MKPEDLLDALNGIPEEYISEAKPKRRGESRTKKQHAAAGAVRQTAHGHSGTSAQPRRSSRRKDSTMSSNTTQPLWQRVTTGIVAAAACTVFVGGGVFIAQQAALNQPDVANGQRITNFLGGSGEIHVANTTKLMYDDNRIYLYQGILNADRSGPEVARLNDSDETLIETMRHTLWDGEQFYYADGTSIYRMDMTGNREEEPFYTVSEDDLRMVEARLSNYNIWVEYIQKLTDDYYVINFSAIGDTIEDAYTEPTVDSMLWGYVYQPETGEQVTVPAESVLFMYLSDGENTYYTPCQENGGLYAVQLDTTWTEPFAMNTQPLLIPNGWLLADNGLYYMSEKESHDEYRYVKIDLDTHAYTELMAEPPFASFYGCDGRIYAITEDKNLVCADPEWANPEVFHTFDDTMPELVQENLRRAGAESAGLCVENVDENYILMSMNGGQFALLDRQTGTVRYFYETDAANLQEEPDASESEAKPAETVNIFGGSGELRPVDWDVYGLNALYRDDEFYYCYCIHDDNDDWYRCPLAGGTWELVPLDDPIRLLSDGERIYTETLSTLDGGGFDFDFRAVFRDEEPVINATEQLAGKCDHIWHIRDRYFVVGTWTDHGRTDEAPNFQNAIGTFTVWLDEEGTPLEYQLYGGEWVSDRFFCDTEQENMYSIMEGTIRVLQTPDHPLADYTAPETAAYITFANVSAGKTVYFDAFRLYIADENGKETLMDDDIMVSGYPYIAPDGSIYYSRMNDFGGWGVYMRRSDTSAPVLLRQTGSDSPVLCGFTEDPESAAGYDVVFFIPPSKPDPDSDSLIPFVFMDPALIATKLELRP